MDSFSFNLSILFNFILDNSNWNVCIIEHITLILCYWADSTQSVIQSIFKKVMASPYRCHCLCFLLDIISGKCKVKIYIKTWISNLNRTEYKLIPKLETNSSSIELKRIYDKLIYNKLNESNDSQMYFILLNRINKNNNKLFSGIIHHITAILQTPNIFFDDLTWILNLVMNLDLVIRQNFVCFILPIEDEHNKSV